MLARSIFLDFIAVLLPLFSIAIGNASSSIFSFVLQSTAGLPLFRRGTSE